MSQTDHQYRAFISYSHRDAKWAKWLHRSLERYVVPSDAASSDEASDTEKTLQTRKLTPIFRDREDIPASGSLALTIYEALESSENLIVLCSPSSADSQYVNAEIDIFRGLHPDNDQKIYALIVEGDPPNCFPPALTAEGAEPIAADARETGDGKVDAKLKLIAGMLGVGFDRLKQREAKRQRSRLLAMVAVVSAVAVMTSFLALWALNAEGEASEQRELAEQQKERAEQQHELADEQRLLAEQSAAESKAVLHFFESRILAAARPKAQAGGLGIDATIRAAVDEAVPDIKEMFTDKPLVAASIRHTLGETYRHLGQRKAAIEQNEKTFELRAKFLGREHQDTLRSMRALAVSYWEDGRYKEALKLSEEALQLSRQALGTEDIITLGAMNELATSYQAAARHEEALALFEEALALQKKVLGDKHPGTIPTMNNLAILYGIMGRHEEELSLYGKVMSLLKQLHDSEHPDTLISMNNLATSLRAAGRNEEALTLFEETLDLQKKVLGNEHPNTLKSMSNVALSYSDAGRNAEALALRKTTLTLRMKSAPDHPDTLSSISELVSSYVAAGRHEDALNLTKETRGAKHPDTLQLAGNLALVYKKAGRLKEAVALQINTLKLQRELLGKEHPDTLTSMSNLANSYAAIGHHKEALILREETLKLQKSALGIEHPDTLRSMSNLAVSYRQADRHDDALTLCERVLELQIKVLGSEHLETLRSMNNLAACYLQSARLDNAEKMYRELIALRKRLTPDDSNLFYAQLSLGQLLLHQRQYPEAEPLLLSGYEGLLLSLPAQTKKPLENPIRLLIQLYENWGKTTKSAKWRTKLKAIGKPE
ncbi:MAG: toll/interleukin-1 receptor domain-containing protein [Verrucomicrobia bacterium]|nr:toll/interleukin-1 receptor domain-containing protein [Verrucomicrobiota bacterium]